jgi:flagellar protein FliS
MQLQDAYLESQIQTADPLELVRLLYRAAGDAIRSARAHMAAGRIGERSRQISKAFAILTHLAETLDHARGGTLSNNLAQLYDYMQRRLLEANQSQKAEPLAEVGNLMATLLQGWDQVRVAPQLAVPAVPIALAGRNSAEYGGDPANLTQGAAPEYASHSWSL